MLSTWNLMIKAGKAYIMIQMPFCASDLRKDYWGDAVTLTCSLNALTMSTTFFPSPPSTPSSSPPSALGLAPISTSASVSEIHCTWELFSCPSLHLPCKNATADYSETNPPSVKSWQSDDFERTHQSLVWILQHRYKIMHRLEIIGLKPSPLGQSHSNRCPS